MNLKDKKGSISIFVLVALLFMSSFLLVSYAANVNKSKAIKEQFNIISQIYAYNGGDEGAYDKAYTDLRKKNKQTITTSTSGSNILNLNKTYAEKISNYTIYGNTIQDGNPTPEDPIEPQSVGNMSVNLFDMSKYTNIIGVLAFDCSSLIEGKTYTISSNKPLYWFKISDHPSGYGSIQTTNTKPFYKYTFVMQKNQNIPESAIQYIFIGVTSGKFISDISELEGHKIQIQEGTIATDYEQYGKYIIPIEVSNGYEKNLFNITNYTVVDNVLAFDCSSLIEGEKYTLSSNIPLQWLKISTGSAKSSSVENRNTKNGFYTYTFTMTRHSALSVFDTQYIFLGFDYTKFSSDISEFKGCKIQIEKGDVATEYEPYAMRKVYRITLDEPLRKIGNVQDSIDLKTGQITRKIIDFTLDGSQTVSVNTTAVEGYLTYHISNNIYGLEGNDIVYSNKFIGQPFWSKSKQNKREQLASATSSLTLRISTNRGVEHTSESIMNWLKENPVEVLHVLKEEKYEYIPIELPEIELLEDYTKIKVLTNVKPSKIEIQYIGYTLD